MFAPALLSAEDDEPVDSEDEIDCFGPVLEPASARSISWCFRVTFFWLDEEDAVGALKRSEAYSPKFLALRDMERVSDLLRVCVG